jgi:hypothetical protein
MGARKYGMHLRHWTGGGNRRSNVSQGMHLYGGSLPGKIRDGAISDFLDQMVDKHRKSQESLPRP